ncbi:LysR family transcriptional regulator [Nocardia sp. NBC_01499]|uniref:LysR family transcriptional regulator n=1 Tax=Nocardia sp. NBC_01499 TaxID=2903597 RepID=UPI00386EA39A
MQSIDLNLLTALDALLDERSVTAAAERLHTSPPTMSRTLSRLRRVFHDPLLVRAGREMVLTPRAVALREQVQALVGQAQQLFDSGGETELSSVTKTFTVQINDILVGTIVNPLLAGVRAKAPGLTLRFVTEEVEGSTSLRDGAVDLEIGVISSAAPDIYHQELITDRMVSVVRANHPLLTGALTPHRYAEAQHLSASRRGKLRGPVDEKLAELGLHRQVVTAVPSWVASMHVVASSDLIGLAPEKLSRQTVALLDLRTFLIPFDLPPVVVSQAWHARYQVDPAHAWLRHCVNASIVELDGQSPVMTAVAGAPPRTAEHR